MKPEVLLLQPLVPALDHGLHEIFTPHRLYAEKDKAGFLREVGSSVRGVITGGAAGIRVDMMENLPALEIVAITGIGTDAVDLGYAKNRKIHVTTTPGVLTDDVADLALGLVIGTLRGIPAADRYVRNGLWGKQALPLARKVTGKRVGIVGLGKIGRAIAKRLASFDCEILYNDIVAFKDVPYQYIGDLASLANESDVLVLAASADQGQAIITTPILEALGPTGILINVARGKLVDEQALVNALRNKTIAGAGLDVFVDEPNVPAALFEMDNVLLQPHRASATEETRRRMGEIAIANVEACFAGQEPPNSVIRFPG